MTASPRLTLKSIAAHILRERGVVVEMWKGEGYFYFTGEATERWQSQGVYNGSTRLSDDTLDGWLAEFDLKVSEAL